MRENLIQLLFRNNIIEPHGDQIKVQTEEGERNDLKIQLPITA
jgi:hypothetical protein